MTRGKRGSEMNRGKRGSERKFEKRREEKIDKIEKKYIERQNREKKGIKKEKK